MVYDVRRSRACRQNLDDLFDHLVASYEVLGEDTTRAFGKAEQRVSGIADQVDALGLTSLPAGSPNG